MKPAILCLLSLLPCFSALSQINCNSWLRLNNAPDGVRIGDLDVNGTKITVEAVFNRTAPYNGTYHYAGDIVSKHIDPKDVNYLLRPEHAEITTSNGFFATTPACNFQFNKTYHVAMVYDGATLKFYRNGYLLSQVSATGSLVTNNWQTKIGETAGSPYFTALTNFVGYITEVRIWNVARTQAEIKAYLNTSLPSPTTQPGLLAYYVFNNLLNKQGNVAFNGTPTGNPGINTSNPGCNFIADSCNAVVTPSCALNTNRDTSICIGSSYQLNASGASSYSWSPVSGLSNPGIANPIASVTATATYTVTGTTLNGCSASKTVTITALPKPSLATLRDTSVCGTASIQLKASGAQSYEWSPALGLDNPLISNPKASVISNITYTVIGTASNGCKASDSSVIVVLPKPILSASNDTAVCEGKSVQMSASGGQKYEWSPSTGLSSATVPDPIATINSAIAYTVTTTASNGCFSAKTISIALKPKPNLVTSKDTVICASGAAQLFVTGAAEYKWHPATSLTNSTIYNPTASPSTNTRYLVFGVSSEGCDAVDSVDVNVKEKPAFPVVPSQVESCAGEEIQLKASGGDSYIWAPSRNLSDAYISDPIVKADTSIVCSVTIRDTYCNNQSTLSVPVTVNPKPIIIVSKTNDITCNQPAAQIKALGAARYRWTPSTGLSDPNISSPVASVQKTTTYYVRATAVNGCESTDSIKVNFLSNGDLNALQLPTAFTPNGDHLNDCFGLKSWGNVEIATFNIYNRWGEVVFRGKTNIDCWDGRFKGLPEATGAFPYLIKVKTACGEVERKGLVVLIR